MQVEAAEPSLPGNMSEEYDSEPVTADEAGDVEAEAFETEEVQSEETLLTTECRVGVPLLPPYS